MDVKVLSEPTSRQVVVQLPGRSFPGIVIQGDTLAIWQARASEAASQARTLGDAALLSALSALEAQLTICLGEYNHVCAKHGGTGIGR
jgi:DNA-binding helix-hairpin-helix protein with protein kinase domain